MKRQAVIIGAGPAGLTAAYELLDKTEVHPLVCEETGDIGGISKTVEYKGNRIDIGGHRFFSKSDAVMDWWQKLMPLQGSPSKDDLLVPEDKELQAGGPDPEKVDRLMLLRRRISRIFYLRKFFEYPVALKWETFRNMGLLRTLKAGFGYLFSVVAKRKENSLEDFYINRFGKPLYKMFFEDYTEKVWGFHPSKLGADWGAQRVKGLSLMGVLLHVLKKPFRSKDIRQKEEETSLIEQFIYPKLGPGQLWETAASEIRAKGGELRLNSRVNRIQVEGKRVVSVGLDGGDSVACDYLLSSMPLKDLVAALRGIDVPDEVRRIADGLQYRDFITVGLLVDELKIKNHTKIKTYKERVPDTWIYIQERDVKVGRLQIFNNWSPYMVADYEHKMWIGLEYFCTEGDAMWNLPQETFIRKAIDELVHIDIIERESVCDAVQLKVKKAYPTYYGTYYELEKVKNFLDGIENLYCIGRNGQHRYNNQDHSMLTAMEAVGCIRKGDTDKSAVWNVNTEEEYHESKKQ
ncbi:MAG: NAD(P)/FAD-dependent oxidoreductase [Tannerella sp.]|jgi:protoporphyrinogen oxidase|nr:NAD(P)/FAD-dependent oxidoreductase [Tannerella sp.]